MKGQFRSFRCRRATRWTPGSPFRASVPRPTAMRIATWFAVPSSSCHPATPWPWLWPTHISSHSHLKQRGPLGLADKPRELVLYQESKTVLKIDGSICENVMAEVISNELWPLVLLEAAVFLWHKNTRVATRTKSFLRSWGSRRDWKDAPDPCQHLQPWILWPKRFLWPKWLKMVLK